MIDLVHTDMKPENILLVNDDFTMTTIHDGRGDRIDIRVPRHPQIKRMYAFYALYAYMSSQSISLIIVMYRLLLCVCGCVSL